jgi:drug/metabolite transporter (DMT)-like permease
MKSGIWAALGAAVLFGLSTPLAKLLTGQASPLLLAGLLYTGSGIGLTLLLVVRVMVGGRAGIVLFQARTALWGRDDAKGDGA